MRVRLRLMPTMITWCAVAVVVSGLMIENMSCFAQRQQPQGSSKEGSLKEFLRNYLSSPRFTGARDTRYFPVFVDLRDDGKQEAIVYLTGNDWCGSGGCTTMILSPKDSSYEVVAKIMITRLPISVLATKSNDWHDISVRVQGGSITHGYDARLLFNGRTYPSNPTVPPAMRLGKQPQGKVIVPLGIVGMPLY